MAKQDDQYESALGSIFDFIFTNNKEPGRPLQHRPSGADGGDEFARALSELVTQPYTYLPDSVLNIPNEAAKNAKLMAIDLDDDAGIDLNVGNVVGALKDPNKFVDAAFDDLEAGLKTKRMDTGAQWLNYGIAMAAGISSGMSISDASAFATSAKGTYKPDRAESRDFGLRNKHQEITASNAAIEANIDQAKEVAVNEGLDPNSSDFGDRVYEIVQTNKAQIEDDTKKLHKAMKGTPDLRKYSFIGEKPDKNNDLTFDYGKPQKQKNESNAQFQARLTTYDNKRNEKIDEVRRLLIRDGVDPGKANKMVFRLKKEADQNDSYQGGLSAYRLMYAKNQSKLAQLATNEEELRKHLGAAGMAYTWERMHGGSEDVKGSFNTSLVKDEFKAQKDRAEAKIADPNTSADERAALQGYINSLDQSIAKVSEINQKNRQRLYKSGDYFRAPLWVNSDDYKVNDKVSTEEKVEGTKALMSAEKERLNIELRLAEDDFEKRRIMADMVRVDRGLERLEQPQAFGQRAMLLKADWTTTFRMMRNLSKGPKQMGRDLITGKAFAAGHEYPLSPGVLGNSNIQTRKRNDDGTMGYGSRSSKLVLPKDHINKHYSRLAGVYYITPGSLVKTALWNGEGFNYVAEMKQRGLQSSIVMDRGDYMKDFLSLNQDIFQGRRNFDGMFRPDGTVDLNIAAKNYLELIDVLGEHEDRIPDNLEQILKQMKNKYKSLDRFSRIGKAYSKYNPFLSKRILLNRLVASRIGTRILARIPKGQVVGKILTGQVALRTAIKSGVHTLAAAIGVGTGFVGTVVIEVIAFVGEWVAFKLARPVFKLSLGAMLGICGLCGFLFMLLTGSESVGGGADVSYTTFVPETQTYCAVGGGSNAGDFYTWTPPNTTGTTPPPQAGSFPPGPYTEPSTLPPGTELPPSTGNLPSDAECPLSETRCTQDPYGNYYYNGQLRSNGSHTKETQRGAIDIGTSSGTFSAPTDGVVTFANANNTCEWNTNYQRGGQLAFVDTEGNVYNILHIDPTVSAGEVSAGTVLGRVTTSISSGGGANPCWTGAHLHISISQNGTNVNAEDFLNSMGCSISCP